MFEHFLMWLGSSWVGVFIFLTVLWLIQRWTRNAAILDVGWTLALAGVTAGAALKGSGWPERKALLAIMVGLWAFRLSLYLLFTRVLGSHPEDPRYTDLKKKWGRKAGVMMFLTFHFQGLSDVLLAAPFFFVCANPQDHFSVIEYLGSAVWGLALIGETMADLQLHGFKSNPANRGKTCRAGLWNYSRHPNYFFEWLIWCGYALYSLSSPWGYLALIGPVLMFYFLFKVTGIPLTEAQAVKTKGMDYIDYQRTTSVFVPWFKKER